MKTTMTTTMNRTDFAQAIETNRIKLLRMVSCWLMLANFMRRTRLTLSPRIGRWILSHILKAEISVGMLVMTSAHIHKSNWLAGWGADCVYLAHAERYQADGAMPEIEVADLDEIIARLKTLLGALKKLGKKAYRAKQSESHKVEGAFFEATDICTHSGQVFCPRFTQISRSAPRVPP